MRTEHLRCALRLAVVLLLCFLLQNSCLARYRLWGAMPLP